MNDDAIGALGIFFIGLAILLVVGTIVALIWFIIATIAMEIRFQNYRRQAEEHFDRLLKEEGALDDVESTLNAMYPGIAVGQTHYANTGEFVSGVLFGREQPEDNP